MQSPGVVHLLGRADRQDVGGAVRDAYARARRGDLHHGLGVVGGRVVAGLVGGGDTEAGAVVEGAVVQSGRAALGGLDHPGDGGGAVGGEDGLAGLDLELEAEAAGRQPMGLLEGLEQPGHGGDLLGIGHLRQRQDQPLGQAPVRHQAGEEDVEGADAPVADRRLQALHADAHVGGGRPVPVRLGDQPGRAGGRLVLLRVRAGAVAVLEVDPQVLDGLPLQLGADAVVHGSGQLVAQAEDGGEGGRVRGVFVERGERLVAPGADGAGVEDVAGHVDGVHGLAGTGVPRVEALQFGVDRREGGADLLADGAREARRHVLLLALTHPAPSCFPLLGINNPQYEVIRGSSRGSTPSFARPPTPSSWRAGGGDHPLRLRRLRGVPPGRAEAPASHPERAGHGGLGRRRRISPCGP